MVIEDLGKRYRGPIFTKNEELPIAHPIDRLAAFLVDVGILSLLGSVLLAPIQKNLHISRMLEQDEKIFSLILSGIGIISLLCILYQFFFTWLWSATPGKKIFQLRVINIWNHHQPVVWECFVRSFLWWWSTLLLMVPHMAVYSDQQRRPFHDRVANTVVISVGRRRGLAPLPIETSFIRFFSVLLIFTVLISVALEVSKSPLRSSKDNLFGELSLMTECETVSTAYEDWPLEKGDSPKRISVALSLYAGGLITDSCLDQEALGALRQNEGREMAFLARAFVTSDDAKLSDAYLGQVCAQMPDSEACHFSHLIELWTEHDWDGATQGFDKLLDSASLYVKVWAVKHYEKTKDYKSELDLIDDIWPLQGLAEFLGAHRTVAFWGLHREPEALATFASVVETMDANQRTGLSGWLCYNELDNGCEALEQQSCKLFDSKLKESVSQQQELVAITSLKIAECRGELTKEWGDEVTNPLVSQLAFILNQKNSEQKNEKLFSLLKQTDSESALAHELMKRIISLAKEPQELEDVTEYWQKLSQQTAWNWAEAGKALFEKQLALSDMDAALATGTLLVEENPGYTRLQKELIMAAHSAHEFEAAWQWLKKSPRAPASVESLEGFEDIREDLMRRFEP